MNCYACGAEYEEGNWCNCHDYDYEDYQYKEEYDITDHIASLIEDYQKGIISAVVATETFKELGVDNLEIIRIIEEYRPNEKTTQNSL